MLDAFFKILPSVTGFGLPETESSGVATLRSPLAGNVVFVGVQRGIEFINSGPDGVFVSCRLTGIFGLSVEGDTPGEVLPQKLAAWP